MMAEIKKLRSSLESEKKRADIGTIQQGNEFRYGQEMARRKDIVEERASELEQLIASVNLINKALDKELGDRTHEVALLTENLQIAIDGLKSIRGHGAVYCGQHESAYTNQLMTIARFAEIAISKAVSPINLAPVPLIIYCPAGHQHIDEGEWATRPHKTHQCQHVFDGVVCNGQKCGLEWRPADFPTVGVAHKETK